MVTLYLYGYLASLFGDTVSLDVATPREAVTALAYQSPDYRHHLTSNNWHIFAGKDNDITQAELDMDLGNVKEVYLMPAIEGAGSGASGWLSVIVGAALIVGSFFAGPAGPALLGAGIGLVTGGIITLVTPIPGVDDMSQNAADEKASFLFKSPTNTSTQGVPIPLGYGKMMIGSIVVSSGLYAEDVEVDA